MGLPLAADCIIIGTPLMHARTQFHICFICQMAPTEQATLLTLVHTDHKVCRAGLCDY